MCGTAREWWNVASAMCTECNQRCIGKACSELARLGRIRLWVRLGRRVGHWIISVCLLGPNCFRKLSGRSQTLGEGLNIRTMSVSRLDCTYLRVRGSKNRSNLSDSVILATVHDFNWDFRLFLLSMGGKNLIFPPSLVKHHVIKAYGKMDYIHLFSASVLHGCQLSASCPGHFTAKTVEPIKHCVGPRAYLGAEETTSVPNLFSFLVQSAA
jgi:hypothetical protein